MFSSRTIRWAAFLLVFGTCLLFMIAGCRGPIAPIQSQAIGISHGDYVGSAACQTCHPAECAGFAGSRHATTLHLANQQSLGKLTPPLGVIPLAGYALAARDGNLILKREYPTPREQPLHYALGSGKLGMTYVSLTGQQTLVETHMSYFPPEKMWDITPGQETHRNIDTLFGHPNDKTEARRCIGCHTTYLPEGSLKTDPQFFGVQCESCHGPGKQHIAAMQVGKFSDLHMEVLGRLKPSALNERCGKCHRTALGVDIESIDANQTHRFQPYGLARSQCRMPDGEPLSCLLCHDVHKNVSTDTLYYNSICVNCHTPSSVHSVAAKKPEYVGRVCPVNAKSECVTCHMLPKKAFPQSTIKATMIDHFIAVPNKRRKR